MPWQFGDIGPIFMLNSSTSLVGTSVESLESLVGRVFFVSGSLVALLVGFLVGLLVWRRYQARQACTIILSGFVQPLFFVRAVDVVCGIGDQNEENGSGSCFSLEEFNLACF